MIAEAAKLLLFASPAYPRRPEVLQKNKKMPIRQIKEQVDLDYYTTIYRDTTPCVAFSLH
jgi:hypothetical protein